MSIYIDLDGTLISEWEEPVYLFPGSLKLLRQLRELDDVYLLTFSRNSLARKRNVDFFLNFPDSHIIGRETILSGAKNTDPNSILIENTPWTGYGDGLTEMKCDFLGISPDRIIMIESSVIEIARNFYLT